MGTNDHSQAEIAEVVSGDRDDDTGLSLQNPTWDYLHRNFKKVELQKHCRDLGLTKIWVTKEKLIDMIIEKTKPPSQDNEQVVNEEQFSNRQLQIILSDIRRINEKLNGKDEQIRDLSEKLRDAQETINGLYGRMSVMEERIQQLQEGNPGWRSPSGEANAAPVAAAAPVLQEKTLLLGDGNLSQIVSSDLKKQL